MAVAAAVLGGRRGWRTGLVVLAAGALAWSSATLLKDAVDRPRPEAAGAEVEPVEALDSPGWPSAHAAVATASLAAAAMGMGRRPGAAVAAGAVVGLARVVVGVHLPLDAVGGVALGLAVAVLVTGIVGDTAAARAQPAGTATA